MSFFFEANCYSNLKIFFFSLEGEGEYGTVSHALTLLQINSPIVIALNCYG